MYQTKHFVTGNFTSHATHVDDRTYSLILDNIVKATCDIFLVRNVDTQEAPLILMGERVGLPHADWWIPGGRMMPGETVAKCCKRVLHRELGLHLGDDDVAEVRVRTVSHFTFVWDTRTQMPVHNGTCDVSIILRVDVTENEASCISLNHKEYKQLEWRPLDAQLRPDSARPLHPALMQGMTDLSAMIKWDSMMAMLRRMQLPLASSCSTAVESLSSSSSSLKENEAHLVVQRLVEYCTLRGELGPLHPRAVSAGRGASPSPPQPDGFVHRHHGDTHAASYHPPRHPPAGAH
jgi:ADP-ribose pyrophosphatase YjhB (NUDIX family)